MGWKVIWTEILLNLQTIVKMIFFLKIDMFSPEIKILMAHKRGTVPLRYGTPMTSQDNLQISNIIVKFECENTGKRRSLTGQLIPSGFVFIG